MRVEVAGSSHYAVTVPAGGYAVPVPGNGTYAMRFAAAGWAAYEPTARVTNLANVKMDYAPPHAPPVISGPERAWLSHDTTCTFAPVGAAQGHQWKQARRGDFRCVEGAESGLGHAGFYRIVAR